jgi:hypothetical protein
MALYSLGAKYVCSGEVPLLLVPPCRAGVALGFLEEFERLPLCKPEF